MAEAAPYDVAIVGGGACGLSVLIQVIEKSSSDLRLVIFEKRDTIGPGLAYSKACHGARINTHASSMGLSASNPGDFVRWMEDNPSEQSGGGMYPYRSYYGRYIQSEMERASKLALTKGIEVRVCRSEVTDIEQQEGGFTIHAAGAGLIRATKAVLATGNHIRQLNKHLNGRPHYFEQPWPSSRLLEIPKHASVAILGSRLTAIDEALFLIEHGHTGKISLFSRTGQLPKVQGGSKKYERAYTLYNLARELEESPDYAMLKIARHVQDEIESISCNEAEETKIDFSQDKKQDLLSSLRHDVGMAQRDEVPIFRVLTETGPMSERYWNCLGTMGKKMFLKNYMSTWISYRAAMPLQRGQKLLELLESGQVQVVRTDPERSISYDDGHFQIPVQSSEGTMCADALVEATGMEFDIKRIETPLMQNLLSRQLVKPHVASGIDVDFRTLKAREDFYCLGSLTRGVHFHTTTLDRSVVHAEWVADSILDLPPRKFLHIALFVGHDLFSQVIVSQLVPLLLGAGHVPFVYVPTSRSGKRRINHQMRELDFYETTLLQNTVIPYLGPSATDAGPCLTIRQLRQRYGILVQNVPEIEDSEFVKSLEQNHIDFGYGVRWSQSFGIETVNFLQSRQGLFTLHPSSPLESMLTEKGSRNQEAGLGYELQEIQYDQCEAVHVYTQTHPIDYSRAMLIDTETPWQGLVQMMSKHTEQIARGHYKSAEQSQDSRADSFHVSPTDGELAAAKTRGIESVDKENIKKVLIKAFSPVEDSDGLKRAVENACRVRQDRSIARGLVEFMRLRQNVVKEESFEVSHPRISGVPAT